MRPRGLSVALRYGRAALDQSVVEIDVMVAAAIRTWLADTSLQKAPRVGGWESIAKWACACASGAEKPQRSIIEKPMHNPKRAKVSGAWE